MKINTSFAMSRGLMVVPAWVWGPRGVRAMSFALDTGATSTTIRPEVMDALGYDVRDGINITKVVTAHGKEDGYRQRVTRFSALDFNVFDFPIHVFDLHEGHKFHGLIGLNFLCQLNYEVRSLEKSILAERAAA